MIGCFRLAAVAIALCGLAAPAFAGNGGGFSCPDRTPLAVAAPGDAASSCQKAITKESAKFVKTRAQALSKCMLKSAPGTCPSADDTAKIESAALKASEKIAKACAEDPEQAALGSSYSALQDETVIGSCLLSQGSATADILVANATGVSTEDLPLPGLDNEARAKCTKETNKTGVNFALSVRDEVAKCLDKAIKQGTADLAAACIGSFAGGVFVPPTDSKTAGKITKLVEKASKALDKKCGAGAGTWLPSVFACGGAETVAELQQCLLCEGWGHAVDLVEQQYAENGVFVENGAGAIEAAVNAAAPGAKLLIEPGDYAEQVTIEVPGLSLVGCGAATNDRPRLVRPEGAGPFQRGIFAAGQDGLHFQSLEVVNWDDDGIFVQGAAGVSFRDVIGDGMINSTYAVFPVESTNVLIEGCVARNVADAGLYVGSSEGIVVRYNRVEGNVAGLEIENSIDAFVHNNYATENTGGLLVFKLPGPPLQESRNHTVSHNVSVANNTDNFADPGGSVAAVPRGTGFLVLSNDDSIFEYNVAMDNDTFGFLFLDQEAANAFGAGFDPTSADQKAERNLVTNSVFTGNGSNPDALLGGNIGFLISEIGDPPDHGNCFVDNVTGPLPDVIQVEPQCM